MPRSIDASHITIGSPIQGVVSTYANLPSPPSAYAGAMYMVSEASGGFFGLFRKHPAGLYTPSSDLSIWITCPSAIRLSEDTTTLVNIPNEASWIEYFNFAVDIGVGDRLLYNGDQYSNLTGAQSTTVPNLDTTNWAVQAPIHNLITVAESGGDYTSIKDACDSITDNSNNNRYTINIAPGVYVEDNPLQTKEFVSMEAIGIHSVIIQPLNASADLFIGSKFAHIVGVVFDADTGASNYAVNHSVDS